MARIPFQTRRRTIPGGSSIPLPRADATAFGGGSAKALQAGAIQVGNAALGVINKKNKDEADLFLSKHSSEARAYFAKRANEIRIEENGGDVAPRIQAEWDHYTANVLSQSPNKAASIRTQVAFDAMKATSASNSIAKDDLHRQNNLIIQSGKSHENNMSAVYDDFSSLDIVLVTSEAELNNLAKYVDPLEIAKLKENRKFELGKQAVIGLIDSSEMGAEEALSLLNHPDDLLDKKVKTSDRQQLVKYAETAVRTHQADKTRKIAADAAARVVAQRGILNGLMDTYINGGMSMSVLKESSADARNKSFFMTLMRQEVAGSPPPPASLQATTYVALIEAIDASGLDDVEEVKEVLMAARSNRLIIDSQFSSLLKRLEAPQNKSRKRFETALKNAITKSNPIFGLADPKGDELYLSAMMDVDAAVRKAEEDGTPLHKLFTPGSDEYIGPMMDKYKRTMDVIVSDLSDAAETVTSPSIENPEIDPDAVSLEPSEEAKKLTAERLELIQGIVDQINGTLR